MSDGTTRVTQRWDLTEIPELVSWDRRLPPIRIPVSGNIPTTSRLRALPQTLPVPKGPLPKGARIPRSVRMPKGR